MGLIFTFGLTYGGAVAALFNPFIGLLVYIAFAILKPERLWYWSVPVGNYSRIVAIALLIGWAIHGFGSLRLARARAIALSLVLLAAWTSLSAALIATNKELAWRWVELFVKIVLPFMVGITTIDSVRKLKTLAWVIVLSEGYLALQFNQWYFAGYNRLWAEGFGDMDNNCNAIALTACIGLGLFLGLGSPQRWPYRVLALGCVLLMIHAVLLSFSRGGMLACLIMGAVSFFLIPKRVPHYLAFALIVTAGFWLAGSQVIERFSQITIDSSQMDDSAYSRIELWKACLESMTHHPLGIGPGNWGEVVEQYGFYKGKMAHTLWLQFGAELGVLGLGLLVSFYGLSLVRLLPICREKSQVDDPWFRHLARGVVASLCGFAVAAQFVSLDLLEHPFYIALIGAGILKLTRPPGIRQANVDRNGVAVSLFVPRRRTLSAPVNARLSVTTGDLPLLFWTSLMPDDPVIYVSVKTPPSKLFVIKARHAIVGEYELPLDTASWTVVNTDGEAEIKDGKLVGKKAGQVVLKAVITFGDGTTRETPDLPVIVRHLVADAVWIEAKPAGS